MLQSPYAISGPHLTRGLCTQGFKLQDWSFEDFTNPSSWAQLVASGLSIVVFRPNGFLRVVGLDLLGNCYYTVVIIRNRQNSIGNDLGTCITHA